MVEVLLIEDQAGEARLTQEVFRSISADVNVSLVADGRRAMAFLRREEAQADAPRPDLILLDLNLPASGGREVLAQIKRDETLRLIPLIVLSDSEAPDDTLASHELRASCYLHKPPRLDDFEVLIKRINDFWLTNARPMSIRRRTAPSVLMPLRAAERGATYAGATDPQSALPKR